MGVYSLGEVIALVSGKGGTGKSALCAALATSLAFGNRRVLAIDMDVGLRNLDIFLGLGQTDVLSFLDICQGHYPLDAALIHPQCANLSFLTAPANGSAADIPVEKFRRMLEQARRQFDFIFLDGPAGIGDGMALAAEIADRCILTTLPDPASIRNGERAGQELEKLGCKNVRLVINQLSPEGLKAMNMTVDDVMDAVGLPLLGFVPFDPDIGIAAAKGKPFLKYSRKGAAAAYQRIAKRIQGLPAPVAVR